jgi:hypothetical protein
VPPSPVDDAPQLLKQLRYAVNLIEDDQLVLVVRKILARIGEPGPVILVFKIQVDRSCLRANLQSESCLSSLARPQKDDSRRMAKQFIQTGREAARDHACNYRQLPHKYIVMFESGWNALLTSTLRCAGMGFLMNGDSPANQNPNGQAKSDAQEYSAGKANPIRTWQQLGNPLMRIRNTWER